MALIRGRCFGSHRSCRSGCPTPHEEFPNFQGATEAEGYGLVVTGTDGDGGAAAFFGAVAVGGAAEGGSRLEDVDGQRIADGLGVGEGLRELGGELLLGFADLVRPFGEAAQGFEVHKGEVFKRTLPLARGFVRRICPRLPTITTDRRTA
jgi:hypothetical protein